MDTLKKVRIVILTTVPIGIASQCLPALAESSKIDIVSIILSKGILKNRFREMLRKLRKILRWNCSEL